MVKNNISNIFGISKTYLANLSDKELNLLAGKMESNEIDRFVLLKPLILTTESIDEDEKKYWFDILPSMTTKQIKKLLEILVVETKKLIALENKYQHEIKALNKKHLQELE